MKSATTPMKIYVVGAGQISGTYADYFHKVREDGKVGYFADRVPTDLERTRILEDIRRHREILVQELTALANAERALTRNEPPG